MNLVEKDRFINEIFENLKKGIKEKTDRMPDHWDGFEIRQFIADYYDANFLDRRKLTGSRKKDYQNDCNILSLF